MSYLAAYGTLRGKWNRPNHFIRKGYLEGYGMYTAGPYPVIFEEEHSKVVVDVFEVLSATLKNLDRYEGISGNASDLYERKIVAVDKDTPVPYLAYAYIGTEAFRKRKLASIPSGDWHQHIKETENIIL